MIVGAGQGLLIAAAVLAMPQLGSGDAVGAEATIAAWGSVVEEVAPAMAAVTVGVTVASALISGDPAEALRRAQVAHRLCDVSGNRVERALARTAEGFVRLAEDEVALAERLAHDALPVFVEGPFPVELIDVFALLGGVAQLQGLPVDAARLFGVADGIAERHGVRWTPLREASRGRPVRPGRRRVRRRRHRRCRPVPRRCGRVGTPHPR